MEFFDIFDDKNLPLNLIKERRKVHKDGDWHRTSQVWVMNRNKEILCNLRSGKKDLFPGYWDLSIGGHVIAGDTYEITAQRELLEEVGISAKLEELIFLSDEKVAGNDEARNLIDREHARLFLYLTEMNLEDFKIQEEEIERLEYISAAKLLEWVSTGATKEFRMIPIKTHYLKILKLLLNLKIER